MIQVREDISHTRDFNYLSVQVKNLIRITAHIDFVDDGEEGRDQFPMPLQLVSVHFVVVADDVYRGDLEARSDVDVVIVAVHIDHINRLVDFDFRTVLHNLQFDGVVGFLVAVEARLKVLLIE